MNTAPGPAVGVDTVATSPRGSLYAGLSREIRAARLLDRTPVRYGARWVVTVLVLAACWLLTSSVAGTWWTVAAAALMGLASTQIAFLGHDAGHQQIAAARSVNVGIGAVAGDLLNGLSIGWWIDKHRRHHAHPNQEDHDPDIGEGVLAFTAAAAERRSGPVARFIVSRQAWLFFPLLLLEGVNLHVESVKYLRRAADGPWRRIEVLLLVLHVAGYLGAAFVLMPPAQALAFIGVHQAVFGLYMGCSFAPNHKGMPILAADEDVDYLRRQVLTSRNVRGGWFVDQVLGGLNYQIEHHLFPSMPRGNLRRAQRLVRAYCADHGVAYTQTGALTSYVLALRYLHSLGEPLRARPGRAAVASRVSARVRS